MSKLLVNLLGTFQVCQEVGSGKSILDLGYDKARALFAFLVIEAGRPHRRARLAGLLWPDMPDAAALHNLRLALYTLRRALDKDVEREPIQAAQPTALLSGDSKSVTCQPEGILQLDITDFLQAVGTWEAHKHAPREACEGCLPGLERAASLYRGDFLAGFFLDSSPFEEWVLLWREQLRQKALDSLHTLLAVMNQKNDFSAAIHYAYKVLEIEPWDENAYCEMMKALAATGQRSAALAQYTSLRKILADEMGTEPSDETRQVYEWLLRMEHAKKAAQLPEFQRLAVDQSTILTRFRQNPFHMTSPFVGRSAELAYLETTLLQKSCRLIVILGPGGIGKSRLATQAALQLEPSFRDGVCLIPLSGVSTPGLIVSAMLAALQIAPTGREGTVLDGVGKQLIAALGEREMLLVIDNLEHLISPERSSAEENPVHLFGEILQTAPQVCMLITSRIRLNCPGEQVLELRGLETPEEGDVTQGISCSSLQLFIENARRADPSFIVNADLLPVLIRICRSLEGIPLSLELAAAWLRVLSLTEIEQALCYETGILSISRAGSGLGSVFDRSWHLLSGDEQAVFARLSIFRGGFDQEAAANVAGAGLFQLASLVDQSLLWRRQDGCFFIHEQLRQYAAAKLDQIPGELQGTSQRLMVYFINFMACRAPLLASARERGEPPLALLTEIELSIQNLSLCAQMLLSSKESLPGSSDYGKIKDFFTGLGLFYEYQGRYAEAIGLYRCVLDWYVSEPTNEKGSCKVGDPIEKRRLAQWQNCLAQAYFNQGVYALSQSAYEETLSWLHEPIPKSWSSLLFRTLSQALQQAARRLGIKLLWPHLANNFQNAEELEALKGLSMACFRNNRTDLIAYATLRLLNSAEAAGATDLVAMCYIGVSLILSFIGFDPLAHYYQHLAERARWKIESVPSRALLHAAMGLLDLQLGLLNQGVRELEQATFLYKQINDYRNWIETISIWISAQHGLGLFSQASDLWIQQNEVARNNGDRLFQGVALIGLAMAAVRLEQYDQALDYCRQALPFIEETPWLPRQVNLLGAQTQAHLHLGQLEQALLCLEAGVQLVLKEPVKILIMVEGVSFLLEAALAMQEDNYPEVRQYSGLLLKMMKRIVHFVPAYTIRFWYYRGKWEWLCGRPRLAFSSWKKSLALSQQMDLAYEQARAHWEIACHLPSENPRRRAHLEAADRLSSRISQSRLTK